MPKLAGMNKLLGCIFLLIAAFTASSQIRGKVVNAVNGSPIPGCSVFISNTSKGTVSSGTGEFVLNDIPAGKYDLVVSSIGYETIAYSFTSGQLPLQLRFEMTVKVRELENVNIETSVEEGWEKWGPTFLRNFIGEGENASHCKILNQKEIKFRYYKKSNRLIAYCDEPIKVENKGLGYLISYQLEDFELSFANGTFAYQGYPLFEPMDREKKLTKWAKKREEAYNGSIMQFMRSIFNNTITQEGFEVKRMTRVRNLEKQRIKQIVNTSLKVNAGPGSSSMEFSYRDGRKMDPDTAGYYQFVMKQPDYREFIDPALLTADSLIIDSSAAFKVISFDNFIYVTYKNELEEKDYSSKQYPPRNPTYQRSYVTLLSDKLIYVDKAGNYFSPKDFMTSAYWGWSEKMANSLPLDYIPTK